VLANFLIGLREGLEAGLIVGILIAYVRKLGRIDVLPRLWLGVGAAIVLSLGVGALLTFGPYGLSFQAQELLGGWLSILAVGLVTWMILWMAHSARELKTSLEGKLDSAIRGAGIGIAVLGFVTVGREGVETALFIWANANSSGSAGIGTAGAILIFRGLIRIDLARFFTWTGLFLVVVAAGVLSYGIGDLQEAGLLPGWGQVAFSVAQLVPPSSWYGTLLGGIFNYSAEPTWLQFAAWLSYLAVVGTLFLLRSRAPRQDPEPAGAQAMRHAA
jgi:high-affinity iron transporter